jgi:hypothetical protein
MAYFRNIDNYHLLPPAFPPLLASSFFNAEVVAAQRLLDSVPHAPAHGAAAKKHSRPRIVATVFEKLESNVIASAQSAKDKARINSLQGHAANAWLFSLPSSHELNIRSDHFKVRVAAHLGLHFPLPLPSHCVCGEPIDAEGIHLRTCKHVGGIRPHNMVVDVVMELMRAANNRVYREDALRHIHSDGSQKCPDILMYPASSKDFPRPLAVDVVVYNPVRQNEFFVEKLSAAQAAEKAKRTKHGKACEDCSLDFIPFAMEFYGALGPAAKRFMQSLINCLDSSSFFPPNWAARTPDQYWLQRLSIALLNGESERVLYLRRLSENKAHARGR